MLETVAKRFFSSFILTFSNVSIILVLIGLYARLSFNPAVEGFHSVLAGFTGFMAAALLWWYFLTTIVSRLRRRLKRFGLIALNRVVGAIFMLIGLVGIALPIYQSLIT